MLLMVSRFGGRQRLAPLAVVMRVVARFGWRQRLAPLAVVLLVLGLAPQALAEDVEAGPQLTCVTQAMRIMAAEVSGMRLKCSVTGAATEQTFSVVLQQDAADVAEAGAAPLALETVCSGTLSNGVGVCTGAVLNEASPGFGFAHLTATLQPSGTQLVDSALSGPPSAAPVVEPKLHYEPLPPAPES